MGWFESQIKQRQASDEARLNDALVELSNAVTGRHDISEQDARRQANNAIAGCLGYYGFKTKEPPRDMSELTQLIDFHLRPTGVMHRPITLTRGWHRDATGPILGFTEDGSPVALLPKRNGYAYLDASTGKTVSVNSHTAQGIKKEAYCFYRPLPNRSLTNRDLFAFMLSSFSKKDYLILMAATLAVVLLGLLLPVINQILFGPVARNDDMSILLPALMLLIGVQFSQILIEAVSALVQSALESKLIVTLQASLMMRILTLPLSCLRRYNAGALALRVSEMSAIASTVVNSLFKSVMSAVFNLIYLWQIFFISSALALPSFAVIVVMIAVLAIATQQQITIMRKQLNEESALNGWQYALIGGIQKIKLAGAEQRGFATWAKRFAPLVHTSYSGPAIWRASSAFTTLISFAGTILIYFVALEAQVPVNDFMAFTVAFGMVTGAFIELSKTSMDIAAMKPQMELIKPILEAKPETGESRPVVTDLSGAVELDRVSFTYEEGQPPVLENFSLKIRRGSYVAIVGKSGCGKSTLIRLMLGFEKPQRGAILYDGRELSSMDPVSLRRQMGVVLQESRLVVGDIFSNIAVSAPWISLEEAWEAAELADIADDIRAMPMGMATYLSEGGGGLSSGQRQRLLIARALASKPKLLLFDEATSTLDNISQRAITEAIDELNCTRIIVAHRLSTIKSCDRIIVIEDGQLIEDGSYDELIARQGSFYDLVKRQQLERSSVE